MDSSAAIIFRERRVTLTWQHLDTARDVEAFAAIMRGDPEPTTVGCFRSSKDVSANAFIVRYAGTTTGASRPKAGGSSSPHQTS